MKSSVSSLDSYIRELQGQINRLSAENSEITAQLQRLSTLMLAAGIAAILALSLYLAVMSRRSQSRSIT